MFLRIESCEVKWQLEALKPFLASRLVALSAAGGKFFASIALNVNGSARKVVLSPLWPVYFLFDRRTDVWPIKLSYPSQSIWQYWGGRRRGLVPKRERKEFLPRKTFSRRRQPPSGRNRNLTAKSISSWKRRCKCDRFHWTRTDRLRLSFSSHDCALSTFHSLYALIVRPQ